MPIVLHLDMMLVRRKVKSNELARAVGITDSNLSAIKSGKIKGIRFSTLEAICRHLRCQPGDILEYISDDESELQVLSKTG
jgi:putative transcriptional regulator